MRLSGLVSQRIEEDVHERPCRVVPGERNRNARLARLRRLLPPQNAIVGIDLADDKQAAVVTDHDSRVLARRRVTARAWELGELLGWAAGRAIAPLQALAGHVSGEDVAVLASRSVQCRGDRFPDVTGEVRDLPVRHVSESLMLLCTWRMGDAGPRRRYDCSDTLAPA